MAAPNRLLPYVSVPVPNRLVPYVAALQAAFCPVALVGDGGYGFLCLAAVGFLLAFHVVLPYQGHCCSLFSLFLDMVAWMSSSEEGWGCSSLGCVEVLVGDGVQHACAFTVAVGLAAASLDEQASLFNIEACYSLVA